MTKQHTQHTEPCTYIGAEQQRPGACTHTALAGSSYCTQHYAVVYKTGTAYARRLKDQRRADRIRDIMSDFDAAVLELESEGFDFEEVTDDIMANMA